jgi:hypothetical protein
MNTDDDALAKINDDSNVMKGECDDGGQSEEIADTLQCHTAEGYKWDLQEK